MFTCRVLLVLLTVATVSISPLAHASIRTESMACAPTRREPSQTFRPIGRGGGSNPIVTDKQFNVGAWGGIQDVRIEDCRTHGRIH